MKFALLALFPVLAGAAILPDTIGAFQRAAVSQPAVSNQALWDEYGLKSSETASYAAGKTRFTATVYRLQDSTAALGAFDWQRPADAKPSSVATLAAETAKNLYLADGNYLLVFEGYKPSAIELAPVLAGLRDVDPTPLPTLSGFLPSEGLVANSERYIIGPAGLKAFDPAIAPSVAAFHLGAEAQAATFRGPKGPMTLAIFNYPTNQIAMQKEGDFRQISGSMVKRTGPLVAVLVAPPDPDAAEQLLAQVRYDAQVTLHERTPTTIREVGNLIVNIFIFIGILIVFFLIAGLFVGGFRLFWGRGRKGEPEEAMIVLHLEER